MEEVVVPGRQAAERRQVHHKTIVYKAKFQMSTSFFITCSFLGPFGII